MNLSELLPAGAVRVLGQASTKKRLFQDVADFAGQVYGLRPGLVQDALQERETLGPTGVGHGVALPHARIEGIDRVVGLFIRLERSLDFDSVDRQPVDLIFTLLAPKDSGVEHLKALALVSRTMRDAGVCVKLRANSDPAALHAVLTEHRSIQAA
ncbi:MAG: PTS sugar transporter subunit IIA [Paracoccaceae bacterium]